MMERPEWLTDSLVEEIQQLRAEYSPLGRPRVCNKLGLSEYKAEKALVWIRANVSPPTHVEQTHILEDQITRIRGRQQQIEDRERAYFELLSGAVRAFPVYKAPALRPVNGDRDQETAVLLLSDWHTGEVVNADEIGGINSYDTATLARRLELLSEKVVSITSLHRKYADIRHLVIAVMGDMTCGTIHEDLEKNAEIVAVEQPAMAGWLLAALIADLSRNFERIDVLSVVGNHGRLSKKMEFKHAFNSYDFQAYQIAALYLQQLTNVHFELGRGLFVTKDIEGWRFVFMHGHTVRGWAGLPLYGFQREYFAAQKRNQFSAAASTGDLRDPVTPVHYLCAGHFHQGGEIDNGIGATILNGSPKGPDEFGYALPGGKVSRPFQRFFGVTGDYGVTFNYPIWLDYAQAKMAGRYADRLPDCWAALRVGA